MTSIQTPEEDLRDLSVYPSKGSVYEAKNMKPKVQWRIQKFEKARNLDFLWKTVKEEQSHPKRKAIGNTTTASTK